MLNMKQVNNFRIFNKILRKYYKRHTIKHVDHIHGRRFVSYWEKEDWLGYRIEDSKQLTPEARKYMRLMAGEEVVKALKNIDEFIDGNPTIWFEDEDGGKYFEGVMLTNRDAYAIIKDDFTSEEEYLYPLYFLVNSKNNLYPSC